MPHYRPPRRVRGPKRLSYIAGYIHMKEILHRILPLTEYCFKLYVLERGSITHEESNEWVVVMNHLYHFKEYFNDFLGPYMPSGVKHSINISIRDVFDFEPTVKHYSPVYRLFMQAFFSTTIGDIGIPSRTKIEFHLCQQMSRFLIAFGPYNYRDVRDTRIIYEEPSPFITILRSSKNLEYLTISLNMSLYVTRFLYTKWRSLVHVYLDFEFLHESVVEQVERHFMKNIFSTENPPHTWRESSCWQPPPNNWYAPYQQLGMVSIRYDRGYGDLESLIPLFMNHCREPLVKFNCAISLPNGDIVPKHPFTFPTIMFNFTMDMVAVYNTMDDLEPSEGFTSRPQRLPIGPAVLTHYRAFIQQTENVQNALRVALHQRLYYVYYVGALFDVGDYIDWKLGMHIHTLSVGGTLLDYRDEEILLRSLYLCDDLRVLNFEVDLQSKAYSNHIHLKRVSVLTVRFINIVKDLHPSRHEYESAFLQMLVKASPNLDVLETPMRNCLVVLSHSGYLGKLTTLSVIDGDSECIIECINRLPCVKTLLLDPAYDLDTFCMLKEKYHESGVLVAYKNYWKVRPFYG